MLDISSCMLSRTLRKSRSSLGALFCEGFTTQQLGLGSYMRQNERSVSITAPRRFSVEVVRCKMRFMVSSDETPVAEAFRFSGNRQERQSQQMPSDSRRVLTSEWLTFVHLMCQFLEQSSQVMTGLREPEEPKQISASHLFVFVMTVTRVRVFATSRASIRFCSRFDE